MTTARIVLELFPPADLRGFPVGLRLAVTGTGLELEKGSPGTSRRAVRTVTTTTWNPQGRNLDRAWSV
jgi:hypothetical protein